MNNRVDASSATNVGLPLAFIANQSFNLLAKYEVTKDLEVGTQQLSLENLAAPGRRWAPSCPTIGIDAFVKAISSSTTEWKIFINIFDKLYYDAFSVKRSVRAGRARAHLVGADAHGALLAHIPAKVELGFR